MVAAINAERSKVGLPDNALYVSEEFMVATPSTTGAARLHTLTPVVAPLSGSALQQLGQIGRSPLVREWVRQVLAR